MTNTQIASALTSVRIEDYRSGVKKIILDRPDKKNAFNSKMIEEITTVFSAFSNVQNPTDLRLVILIGNGDIFCSGADLNYMREQADKNFEENLVDAKKLSEMFFQIANAKCPVISAVRGAAIGGGLGLCACSDYVLGAESAVFATSEVRLGLIPAVISPYIIRKIGVAHASHLMLTGERITASRAHQIGLINQVISDTEFMNTLDKTIQSFLMAEPNAAWMTKELIQKSSPLPDSMISEYTARQIAFARSSKEGREGLRYFFEKKQPHWI